MAIQTKLTPFARFFIFLLIFLPAAYFAAAYYRGEDPIAGIKNAISGETTPTKSTSKSTYDPQEEIRLLKKENKALRQQVEELEAVIEKHENPDGNRQKWGK